MSKPTCFYYFSMNNMYHCHDISLIKHCKIHKKGEQNDRDIVSKLVTLGGKDMPAFSHPIVSTGASPADLIFIIPSKISSQFAGTLAILRNKI